MTTRQKTTAAAVAGAIGVATYLALAPATGPTVTLRWLPSDGATGYKIYGKTNLAGPWMTNWTTGETQLTLAMVWPQCFYHVVATNEGGESR
jgi:hypothetical protein